MSPFYEKLNQGIQSEMENEFTKYQVHASHTKEQEDKIQNLLQKLEQLMLSTHVKVTGLSSSDIAIDKNNLHSEMEKTMVLHSNIIDDIHNLKILQEKMKVLLNSVVGILHHNLKFKNQLKLKTGKELETYIVQEPSYNTINVNIKNIQNMIERSSEYSGMLKQKIGFIRDLTKMRTQEMFSEN